MRFRTIERAPRVGSQVPIARDMLLLRGRDLADEEQVIDAHA